MRALSTAAKLLLLLQCIAFGLSNVDSLSDFPKSEAARATGVSGVAGTHATHVSCSHAESSSTASFQEMICESISDEPEYQGRASTDVDFFVQLAVTLLQAHDGKCDEQTQVRCTYPF